MPAVLIQPTTGKGEGTVNASLSLETPVRWADRPDLLTSLVADQRLQLLRRAGKDEARIWGTYDKNLVKYKRVKPGDLVVFTGPTGIWAIGRIGVQFRNPAFAELLWKPEEDAGVFTHLYSVADFTEVQLPATVLTEALGQKPRSTFSMMASYEGERADALIAALPTPTHIPVEDED